MVSNNIFLHLMFVCVCVLSLIHSLWFPLMKNTLIRCLPRKNELWWRRLFFFNK